MSDEPTNMNDIAAGLPPELRIALDAYCVERTAKLFSQLLQDKNPYAAKQSGVTLARLAEKLKEEKADGEKKLVVALMLVRSASDSIAAHYGYHLIVR
jgi:hypothetical protein